MSARHDPTALAGFEIESAQSIRTELSPALGSMRRMAVGSDATRMAEGFEPALANGRPGTIYGNCCSCSNTNGPCGTGCGGCSGVTIDVPKIRLSE